MSVRGKRRILREEIIHTLAPRIDAHVSHPRIPHRHPVFFSFGTCESDVECVEAPDKGGEDELSFGKNTHPMQEADGAEEFPGARIAGEQLAQQPADGCVHLHLDVVYRLNVQEMRGQSRGMRRGV